MQKWHGILHISMKIARVEVHTLFVNIECFPEKLPGLAISCLREVARGTIYLSSIFCLITRSREVDALLTLFMLSFSTLDMVNSSKSSMILGRSLIITMLPPIY